MKAKSLLLTELLVATGLTLLSLPAGAECWMTCPPGSPATPSPTGSRVQLLRLNKPSRLRSGHLPKAN